MSPCYLRGCCLSTQLGDSELTISIRLPSLGPSGNVTQLWRTRSSAATRAPALGHQLSDTVPASGTAEQISWPFPYIRSPLSLGFPHCRAHSHPGSFAQGKEDRAQDCPGNKDNTLHFKFFLSYLCWAHYLQKCARGACFWTLAEGGKGSMKCCLVGIEEEQKSIKIYRG